MLNKYKNMIVLDGTTNIFNIRKRHFSDARNGDMIAMCNVVAYLRKQYNRPIQFHVSDDAIWRADYCHKMRQFLCDNTDYLTMTPGQIELPTHQMINLWNFRGAVGDHVALDIPRQKKPKVCIFPLFDAPYNTWRNWSYDLTQEVINRFSAPEFDGFEKVFCCTHQPQQLDYKGFSFSSDFLSNVEHILTATHYAGGDTGLSHFAGALVNGPKLHHYHYVESRLHTCPFHFLTKGEMNMFD